MAPGILPPGNGDETWILRTWSGLVLPFKFTDSCPYPYGWEWFRTRERTDTDILGTQRREMEMTLILRTVAVASTWITAIPITKLRNIYFLPTGTHINIMNFSRRPWAWNKLGNFQRLHRWSLVAEVHEEYEQGINKGVAEKHLFWQKCRKAEEYFGLGLDYPLGRVSHLGPRERVRDRIWSATWNYLIL